MQFIARSLLMFLFAGISGRVEAQIESLDADPIFGVPLEWSSLPVVESRVLSVGEDVSYRVLAKVDVDGREVMYLWGRVPIRADDNSNTARGYETDSGMLAVGNGVILFPLGASTGRLASDYPEIKTELLQALLTNYVGVLLSRIDGGVALGQLISAGKLCAELDDFALGALHQSNVAIQCGVAE